MTLFLILYKIVLFANCILFISFKQTQDFKSDKLTHQLLQVPYWQFQRKRWEYLRKFHSIEHPRKYFQDHNLPTKRQQMFLRFKMPKGINWLLRL